MFRPLEASEALSLRGRSPYSGPYQIGIPPGLMRPQVAEYVNGIPTVDGVPLPTSDKKAGEYIVNPPSVQTQQPTIAVFNAAIYGDEGQFRVNLLAGIPQTVLKRPANTRIQLTIQNLNAVGVIAYNFDGDASVANNINIAAGGNRLWDTAVPQGDLSLSSAVNATVVIEFINKDITAQNT